MKPAADGVTVKLRARCRRSGSNEAKKQTSQNVLIDSKRSTGAYSGSTFVPAVIADHICGYFRDVLQNGVVLGNVIPIKMKYALAFAASEFVNFRLIEFISLCQLHQVPLETTILDWTEEYWSLPYVVVNFRDDAEANLIVGRSVLIKYVYHVWCEASCLNDLLGMIQNLPSHLTDKYLNSGTSYKVVVSSANRKIGHEEKLAMIEDVLNAHPVVDATVQLKNPEHQLQILLDYEPRNWVKGTPKCGAKLRRLFYGRLTGNSKRKEIINAYRLANRVYLGNTSMDVRLAGIMANIGLCEPGSLIWDPFLGAGSIVIAASIWGAFGAGSDIDYALLHGMGMSPKAGQGKRMDGECLRTNYYQYGLQSCYLDVVVADAASLHRLLRAPGVENLMNPMHPVDGNSNIGLLDAILTDPPYGFRESSRRVAVQAVERAPSMVTADRLSEITGIPLTDLLKNDQTEEALLTVPHDLPHIPHKETYPLSETHRDLMNLSVRLLKPGGRLVFWIPRKRDNSSALASVPHHPRLRLLAVCEQLLNARNSRLMIAMSKLYPNDPDESDVRSAA
ncbi:hypothetical protein X801_08717, partial [Opisthorchis viverrini]